MFQTRFKNIFGRNGKTCLTIEMIIECIYIYMSKFSNSVNNKHHIYILIQTETTEHNFMCIFLISVFITNLIWHIQSWAEFIYNCI